MITAERTYTSETELSALIRAFEKCTLPRDAWTHEAHLTVATWYLSRHPEGEAARRMIEGIHRYNRAHGSDGYHETITRFWLATVRRHLDTCPGDSMVERVTGVIEMFGDRKDLMFAHYSRDRILSEEARRVWIEPDLRPLEA